MAYSPVGFINRLYNKLSFSDNPNLDVTPYDMGTEQISVSFSRRGVDRLEAATGTVVSLQIFVKLEVTVSIRKTSPQISAYKEAILGNGYVGGTVTLYDDAGNSYIAYNPSVAVDDLGSFNGSEPAISFVVECDLPVNETALAGL